ncbi:TetR family transcriptional regulator [Actinocorallia sp. API 0066]|uniref:TetR family transcriptional regulator n=1 Tax=Actinocorallia sp. API 0066 TaxID=2896846 RepID=UPI001E57F6C3|nr:TetR family transcriptional regulator [Actinocorallia sp. API 0066]MCD0450590.1 TetR family transcriptional regulator [Actinocorallia sp. API 0066]
MTETGTPLRRKPAQRRSAERVQRMLDACAEILDEAGYDGLSTTRIAQRAGVAIGSVYQFFPDKRAVAQALALRNLEEFGGRIGAMLDERQVESWSGLVGRAIDIFVEMHRTVPGFRVLRFGDVADQHLLDESADNNAVVARRLRELIVPAAGVPDGPELERAFAITVESADALIKMAFRREPEGDDAVIGEAKQIIQNYLSGYLER